MCFVQKKYDDVVATALIATDKTYVCTMHGTWLYRIHWKMLIYVEQHFPVHFGHAFHAARWDLQLTA